MIERNQTANEQSPVRVGAAPRDVFGALQGLIKMPVGNQIQSRLPRWLEPANHPTAFRGQFA